jgi:YVTN family beta-propeller protein
MGGTGVKNRRVFWTALGVVALSLAATPALALPAPAAYASSTIRVGTGADGIATSPDGSRVYVTNSLADTLSVIDTATNAAVATYDVDGYPTGVGVSPDGGRVYVSSVSANSLSVLDASSGRVLSRTRIGDYPADLVVSPDGSRVYVANSNSENVAVFDTTTAKVVARVPLHNLTESIAVNPSGAYVYAVVTAPPSAIAVISTATNSVVTTIRLGGYASDMAVDPSGLRGYVTTSGNLGRNGAVVQLDLATNRVVGRIPLGLQPTDIEVSPTGRTVFVANQGSGFGGSGSRGSNGLVSAIDTSSARLVGSTEVTGTGTKGRFLVSLALNRSGPLGYVTLGSARYVATFEQASVPRTPTQPRSVATTVSGRSVTVRWLAPADAGAGPVTGYVVTAMPMAEGPQERFFTCQSAGTTCRLSGLTRGLSYLIQVQARNAPGWSPVATGRLVSIR